MFFPWFLGSGNVPGGKRNVAGGVRKCGRWAKNGHTCYAKWPQGHFSVPVQRKNGHLLHLTVPPATLLLPTCHTTVTHLPRLGVPPDTHCFSSPLEHNIAIPGALAVEGEGVSWSELAEMGTCDGFVQGVVPRSGMTELV